MPKATLKSIDGVEIFSAGTWNGDIYTTKDLDAMIKAFEENKDGYLPHLKLGHDENQELLKAEGYQKDGLPAAGYIANLYRKGQKLLADFVDIPEKIYELIVNKAYRKVSSEIYWNITVNDRKYPYMLGAVALLGADMPGVMNLKDIMALYGWQDGAEAAVIKSYAEGQDDVTVKRYSIDNFDQGEDPMPRTEREIELEAQLKAEREAREKAEAEIKTFSAKVSDTDKTVEQLKAEKEAAEKRAYAAEQTARQAKVDAFVDGLISEKLITPGMKSLFTALLGEEPQGEKKVYSVKVGEKTEEMDKFDLVKNIAKQFSLNTKVNLEEDSEAGDESGANENSMADVQKYADEHKVTFSQAYRALYKGKLKPEKHTALASDQE